MTSRKMVALSVKAADKKAREDLLSILLPAHEFRQGMLRSVRGIGMETSAHGTELRNLCTKDSLALFYTATSTKGEPMDWPKRPIGVAVQHLYHATGRAAYEDGEEDAARAANVWSPDCAKLQSDKTTTWFEAKDNKEASKAVNVLAASLDALRAGKLVAKNCDFNLGKGETCTQAILRLADPSKIESMQHDCPSEPGRECFILYLDHADSLSVVVVASFDEDSLSPMAVFEVEAKEFVVVT